MNNNVLRVGSLVAGVLGLMVGASEAHATSIVIHASLCRSASNSSDIVPSNGGVKNNSSSSSRDVYCSIPRVVPVPDGAATWNFLVDGTNPSGKSTSCTLSAFNFQGTQVGGAQSFTTSATKYDQMLFLDAALVNSLDYTVLFCKLPPKGVLLGLASVDAD